MAGENIPPAGWSEPDARGHVTFTTHAMPHREKHPEREGFECFFVACTPTYTRWTYKPTDTEVEQRRRAVLDLQRTLAMLDIGLNILKNVPPTTQAQFSVGEQAIAQVVNAKNTIADMQDALLALLPADVREQVVRGSRIGADHLRNR